MWCVVSIDPFLHLRVRWGGGRRLLRQGESRREFGRESGAARQRGGCRLAPLGPSAPPRPFAGGARSRPVPAAR